MGGQQLGDALLLVAVAYLFKYIKIPETKCCDASLWEA